MKKIKALSLFSGGLDSILATRLIMDQGVEVEAVQFVTPFFNYDILDNIDGHKRWVEDRYGIHVLVQDIGEEYLQLLKDPVHGFGKNFNPCIDCKIMMFSRAKAMLAERGASFLISGEVLGQRPMSQRRDTMNIIGRESKTRSLLVRPLCGQLMVQTEAEAKGWVDRDRLLRMSGRSRSAQIALAAKFGLRDFPSPAGGCKLADPNLSLRIKKLYHHDSALQLAKITVADIIAVMLGRQFFLPGGGWVIVGRDEKDNGKLIKYAQAEDAVLLMENWPGPTAILKRAGSRYTDKIHLEKDLKLTASLVVRYGKKLPDNQSQGQVHCTVGDSVQVIKASPLKDDIFRKWQLC